MHGGTPVGGDVSHALEQNLWEFWSRFGRGEGCALHRSDGGLWFDTPIPALPYNGVLRFSAERDVDCRIDEIFAHYRQRAVPFLWMIHPSARPADLADRLRRRGMEEAESFPAMSMRLCDIPAPEVSAPEKIGFRAHVAFRVFAPPNGLHA